MWHTVGENGCSWAGSYQLQRACWLGVGFHVSFAFPVMEFCVSWMCTGLETYFKENLWVCVHVGTRVPPCLCGSQKTVLKSWFSFHSEEPGDWTQVTRPAHTSPPGPAPWLTCVTESVVSHCASNKNLAAPDSGFLTPLLTIPARVCLRCTHTHTHSKPVILQTPT